MANVVKISLFTPVEWFGKQITEVELKEPSGWLFAELGEPRVWVRTADGSGYYVEQTTVLSRYVEKSLLHEATQASGLPTPQAGADLIRLMSLVDVMQVKEKLLGFFTEASRRILTQRSAPSSTT
jgi:hypothetical protein